MSIPTTSGVPLFLTIGDAASFLVSDADYGAPDWTAQLVIRDSSGASTTFDATADGSGHLFTLTNAGTAVLKPGPGIASVVYSDGTNRQTYGEREIFLQPNPLASREKTKAETIVAELEDTIEKLSGQTNSVVGSAGQNYTKRDLEQLNRSLTYWKARVIQENGTNRNFSCAGYRPAKCGGRVPWA